MIDLNTSIYIFKSHEAVHEFLLLLSLKKRKDLRHYENALSWLGQS